ncbi:MAG: hypothetical protein HDR04_01440 [Lachnospiraceae bacterium]|nr:hypothetical protein [Lachnospiraceae bacterium]
MKIRTFTKRLNATELGKGATNDTYVAIPNEVDLSSMFENNVAMTIEDSRSGQVYVPATSNIKYTQTGQNNQERISGLGEYFRKSLADVGDEIVFERHEDSAGNVKYYLNLVHRDVIVLQKGKTYAEIIRSGALPQYVIDNNYRIDVFYRGGKCTLDILFKETSKKKKTSPSTTDFYDLVIDGNSILSDFTYQDYIEVDIKSKQLDRMLTYTEHIMEWRD